MRHPEGNMRSKLIRGTARAELDPQIMAFVSKHACAKKPLTPMRVGIKNELGEVYRLILADGMIEMIRADKFLMSIGCIEEVTDEFDLVFRVPSDKR
ncbi:hypothetical protein AWB71_02190 [Caballeronia peredens]|nr:hypothetical protein AWB71_02190 [Caballeronia peredens]